MYKQQLENDKKHSRQADKKYVSNSVWKSITSRNIVRQQRIPSYAAEIKFDLKFLSTDLQTVLVIS